MHEGIVVAGVIAVVEAGDVIRPPAAVGEIATEGPSAPRDGVGRGRVVGGDRGANLGREFRRDALVGVHHQNPFAVGLGLGTLALHTVAAPVGVGGHTRAVAVSQLGRCVTAAAVVHQYFVGERQAFEAGLELGGGVLGDDDGG